MKRYQIHIAGAKRAGKTTLALNLKFELERQARGGGVVILDVDETRRLIFQGDEPALGSPLQSLMHGWAVRATTQLRIKDVLSAGGTPLVTASHSRRVNYDEAREIADEMGANFRFILLETPTFEEAVRRALADSESASDIRMLRNEVERASWEATAARIKEVYNSGFLEPCFRIPQGKPGEMAQEALQYILE